MSLCWWHFVAPAAPASSFPTCHPMLSTAHIWKHKHSQLPSYLLASSACGLALQSSFLRKQNKGCALLRYMHRHICTCVAGTFLINFDHISIPVNGGAGICKHAQVSRAGQSAAGVGWILPGGALQHNPILDSGEATNSVQLSNVPCFQDKL